MAELKFEKDETLGEISLLGKPANKSRFAKICKPSDECLTIPAKYFEEKLLSHSQKRVKILLLSNLSTKHFVES